VYASRVRRPALEKEVASLIGEGAKRSIADEAKLIPRGDTLVYAAPEYGIKLFRKPILKI
jgi:hypothetical protein